MDSCEIGGKSQPRVPSGCSAGLRCGYVGMSARRASGRRTFCVAAPVCLVIVLLVVGPCEALWSKECKEEVNARYQRGEEECNNPICGYLDFNETKPTFLERMSIKCQSLMWQYRDDIADVLGITGLATRMCATSKDAFQASNPIIVETEDVRNFMMCTVPRAASTNLRSLLNMLIRLPDEPRPDVRDQLWDAHFDVYPSVWHYRMDSHPPQDVYPSFIISRNPYTRLLSGFMSKMTASMGQPGYWTAKSVNAVLGLPPTKTWQATRPSFHEFVMALHRRKQGISHIDPHFRLAIRACTYGIRYEYYLRIEDLAQWLPCMEQGLELRKFTQHGWKDTEDGLMFTGFGAGTAEETERDSCWWRPPGMSCAEYYESMLNENGEVVPVDVEMAGDFRLHETRDDGTAGLWRDFYSQKIGDIVYKMYQEDFKAFGYGQEFFH